MSYRKFKPNDILLNTMKTYPSCEFLIFDGRVYYNNIPIRSGSFNSQVPVTGGFISLYEYNVDRNQHNTGRYAPPEESRLFDYDTRVEDEGIIYPFIAIARRTKAIRNILASIHRICPIGFSWFWQRDRIILN